MPWVRLDDEMDEHPKIACLSEEAFALHVHAILYASRALTDGVINRGMLRRLSKAEDVRPLLRELLGARVWDEHEHGFAIHDYLDYQPARASVLAEREANARRKRGQRRNGATPESGRTNTGQMPESGVNPAGQTPDSLADSGVESPAESGHFPGLPVPGPGPGVNAAAAAARTPERGVGETNGELPPEVVERLKRPPIPDRSSSSSSRKSRLATNETC